MIDREQYILDLDDKLLKGGVILSEWCCFIVREADVAFVAGANLAAIITVLAGIETYLRAEYGSGEKDTLYKLIESSPINDDLKGEIHELRKYRNKWVHVADPWNDEPLQKSPEIYDQELEKMAFMAVTVLRETIYENQWI
jgi:hypothetical protein